MKQLVVTGAAGFIASNLVRRLNKEGFGNIILVDYFGDIRKARNTEGLAYTEKIDRDEFIEWLKENASEVEYIFHLGARTDTTEFNFRVFDSLNLSYSKALWEVCTLKQIPLLYASSAATYGMGEHGFSDAHETVKQLKPLNPYGLSKQLFDMFVLEQTKTPPLWYGLKFFNVYGPYEEHKVRMASVVYHAYHQIKAHGKVKLFESHRPDFKDGEQLRDFIHVDDVADICFYLYQQQTASGIYNVGTGKARSFNDLVKAIFHALHLKPQIEYIPTPIDIRDKYQYYTQAEMQKLFSRGYEPSKLHSLEEGVAQYVAYLHQ
ncbi:MAG: ADP-glyceromanno-heptose 6-epimerase [Chitinophagales bacterium]